MKDPNDQATMDILETQVESRPAKETPLKAGHRAAERAADHAEAVDNGWKDRAFEAFCEYGRKHRLFTTEDARLANPDLGPVCSPKAWGHVALRAGNEGKIEYVRHVTAKAKGVHGMSIKLWRWIGG